MIKYITCDKLNLIRSVNAETKTTLGSENKSEKDGSNSARKILIQESEREDNVPNIDLNYMDLEQLRNRAERAARHKRVTNLKKR